MLVDALFDPLSIAVLVIVLGMIALSFAWYSRGRSQSEQLVGGLKVLRNVGRQLAPDHPIRKRLEAATNKSQTPMHRSAGRLVDCHVTIMEFRQCRNQPARGGRRTMRMD